ncbi:DJ-1/PfpI family protein [Marinobacteraceae bacterium S3BR75-40.1]
MSEQILIPIADGVEDIETVTLIDVLRRAELDVVVASTKSTKQVTAARGTRIEADALLEEVADREWKAVILPGGLPGAENLRDSDQLKAVLVEQARRERWFGAICASPAYVLATHGLLDNRKATCYPAFQTQLPDRTQADRRVVQDGNCITSQGPGTALPFALTWAEKLANAGLADRIAEAMLTSR